MPTYADVLAPLYGWESGGKRVTENGTTLVCRTPHVAPEAWLHWIFPALTNDGLHELESRLGSTLPTDLSGFLSSANGIHIFNCLSIYGLRRSWARKGEAIFQPFDLVSENESARGWGDLPEEWLAVGGYDWDGSTLYLDIKANNPRVFRCGEGSSDILNEWTDLKEFLASEINRLSTLFDSSGIQYDEDVPTTPPATSVR